MAHCSWSLDRWRKPARIRIESHRPGMFNKQKTSLWATMPSGNFEEHRWQPNPAAPPSMPVTMHLPEDPVVPDGLSTPRTAPTVSQMDKIWRLICASPRTPRFDPLQPPGELFYHSSSALPSAQMMFV